MDELISIEKLKEAFQKLPSVGAKSAERMAYAVLKMDTKTVNNFADALKEVKEKIHPCPICGLYTEASTCSICSSTTRDHSLLVVISKPLDYQSFEKIDNFNGVYHVLGGSISASSGIGINDLNVNSLFSRIDNEGIKEIIIATNPTIEGETTALYLAKLLESYPIKVSRLAYGLPMGGHLGYADAVTLEKSIKGRTSMKGEDE